MVPPRKVASKDEYYMLLAFLTSSRSKDPNTQVGAIIVSSDNKPISSGYNGIPRRIDDNKVDWSRPNKYSYIHHAEDNAIWHADKKFLEGATIYVTMHPCKHCMLDIVRSGIYKVVYYGNTTATMLNDEETMKAKQIAADGGVELVEYSSTQVEDFIKNIKNIN